MLWTSHISGTLKKTISRLSLLPLAIFYSSLTKLSLLLLMSVWAPALSTSPPSDSIILNWIGILDGDKSWVVRNVLGGMACGFGLRGVS